MRQSGWLLLVVGFVGLSLLAGCGGGGGGGGGSIPVIPSPTPDPELSDKLTAESVDSMVSGDSDFDAIAEKLRDAIAADPGNDNAPVFLAVVEFLDFLETTGIEDPPVPLQLQQIPGVSEFRELYEDAGYENVGGSDIWDLDLVGTDHGEGDYADSWPSADDVEDFVRLRLRAEMLDLIDELEDAPADFEYRITNLDASGEFFDDSTLDDTETVWIDYGDFAMLRSSLHLAVALLDFGYAYSLDDVVMDDFDREDHPGVDAIDLFANHYTDFCALVRTSSMASSRDHVKKAFTAYKAGAVHILAESTTERSNGLITPYRSQIRGSNYFDTTTDRDDFIADEAAFRTWAQGIVDSFGTDSFYEIKTEPDGTAIAADERTSLNFYRLWQGVAFRELYFLTEEHPIDSEWFIALSELPASGDDMLTMDGVIDKIQGKSPTAGDLMEFFGPGLLIDSPPTSTKTIDGNLTDWTPGTNAVTIFRAPAVVLPEGYADAGRFHVAIDGTYLYIAGTADFRGSPWYEMAVDVESEHGFAVFSVEDSDEIAFGSHADPTYALNSSFEVAIPLTNFPGDTWVEIGIDLNHEDDPNDGRYFSDILVKIR